VRAAEDQLSRLGIFLLRRFTVEMRTEAEVAGAGAGGDAVSDSEESDSDDEVGAEDAPLLSWLAAWMTGWGCQD
jgi:hypothetical protein